MSDRESSASRHIADMSEYKRFLGWTERFDIDPTDMLWSAWLEAADFRSESGAIPTTGETPTPRTDERSMEVESLEGGGCVLHPNPKGDLVDSDFARTLERECADLKVKLERSEAVAGAAIRQEWRSSDAGLLANAQNWQERAEAAESQLAAQTRRLLMVEHERDSVVEDLKATVMLKDDAYRQLAAARAEAAKEMQERCAKVADEIADAKPNSTEWMKWDDVTGGQIAKRIRALGGEHG